MNAPPPPSDEKLERNIALLLRVGVILSALVVLVGGSIYLWRHGSEPAPDRTHFQPEPAEYSRPVEIFLAALEMRGRVRIQLGLVLLIATPVVRVAYSLLAFARRRDLVYAGIALVVLSVLLVGLSGGAAGH